MKINTFAISALISFEENALEEFLQLCESVINKTTQNKNTIFKLKSAVHELVVNSVEHGYERKSGLVDVSISRSDTNIMLTVSDFGKGMNDTPKNSNIEANSLEDANTRGWGLLMIDKLSEKFEIKQSESGTIISVTISD